MWLIDFTMLMCCLRLFLMLAALFSQGGVTDAQKHCSVLVTYQAAFLISSDNQWSVQTYWGNPECLVEVMAAVQRHGSSVCKSFDWVSRTVVYSYCTAAFPL